MSTSVAPTIAASLILGALIYKITDLIKYAAAAVFDTGGSRKEGLDGLLSLGLSVAAGEVAVFLFRQTQWAGEIAVGQRTLADLSVGSMAVFGLVVTSIAASLYDVKKAIDRTDTASTPRLLPEPEKNRRRRVEQALGGDPTAT